MEHNHFVTTLVEYPFWGYESVWMSVFFLYIGPETILPLTSILAAVFGVILMFWRWIVGTVRRLFRGCSRVVARLFGRTWHDEELDVPTGIKSEKVE